MTDRFEIPLETSAGQRDPGSFGEKLGVAIAVIALLGGAFVLGGKLLNHDEAVAIASATPMPSTGFATPHPTPAPPPRIFSVDAAPLPAVPPQQSPGFIGWIRALETLPVRSAPSSGANQVGALARGEEAYVEEVPSAVADGVTWLQLDEWTSAGSGLSGVVAATRGTTALVKRYALPQTPTGAWVNGLVASPGEFLAFGGQRSDATGSSPPFMMVSSDGRHWDSVDLTPFKGRLPERVAYGPAGFLAAGMAAAGSPSFDQGPDSIWLWRSPDGIHWDSLGRVAGTEGYYPSQLVGNRDGYELVLDTGRRASEAAWHSSDGLTWTESQGFSGGVAGMVASPTGFYAWPWGPPSGGLSGLRTADGLSWGPVTDGPNGWVLGIISMRDGLLAIDDSPVTGAPRVWMRARADDDSSWFRMPDLPDSSGTAVAAVAGNGQRAVVFGWERSTDQHVAWIGDGTSWQHVKLPTDAFGGALPSQVAVSAAGTVAIGSAPSLRAENPVIWNSPSGTTWSPVDVPQLARVGDATAAHCPALPSDVLELLVLPAPNAIACFGHAPMTFRAWVTPCQGCAGVGPGRSSPTWLQGPDTVAISAIQGQQDLQARLAAGLVADPRWGNQQVEVTGHYDDPAAMSCRYDPDVIAGGLPISKADLVSMCRQAFVITRVRVLPAG